MQPRTLLRAAAIAIGLFALGHTLGMLSSESRGPEEAAALSGLAEYRFAVMGSLRSHHDFYIGEGWYLSAALIAMAVMCWQLSNAATHSPALVHRISTVLAVFLAASFALCIVYFFAAPMMLSAIAALACASASWALRDTPRGRAAGE